MRRSLPGRLPGIRGGAARLPASLRAQCRRRRRAAAGNLCAPARRRRRQGPRRSPLDPRFRADGRAQCRAVAGCGIARSCRSNWSRISKRSRLLDERSQVDEIVEHTPGTRAAHARRGAPARPLPPGVHAAQGLRPLTEGNRRRSSTFPRTRSSSISPRACACAAPRSRSPIAERHAHRVRSRPRRRVGRPSWSACRNESRKRRSRLARERGTCGLAVNPPEFNRWLDADIRHRVAYLKLEATWQRAERLRDLRPSIVCRGSRICSRADCRPWSLALAATSRCCRSPSVRGCTLEFSWERYETPIGGFARIVLEDGSIIDLNTNSALRVRLRARSRSPPRARRSPLPKLRLTARGPSL